MGSLPHAHHFRELAVYQKASHVTQRIFELSKSFPKEETYALRTKSVGPPGRSAARLLRHGGSGVTSDTS